MTIPIRDTLGRSGVGNYPLLEDTDIRGGLRIVTNTTARDAIQSALRTEGMLVYVVADATLYRLESGQWVGLPFGHDLFFSNDATHTIQVKESVDSAGNILNVVAGKGGEYEDGGTLNLRSGDGGDEAVAGNVYIDIGDGIDIEDAYQGHAWIHIGNYKAFNINIGREVLGVPSNALTLTSSWIGLVGKSVVIGKDADSRLYLQGNLGTDIIFAEANPKVIQVKDSTTPD